MYGQLNIQWQCSGRGTRIPTSSSTAEGYTSEHLSLNLYQASGQVQQPMSDRLAEASEYSDVSVPRAALARGGLFGARYELLEEIGRGGSAVVWKARDRVLARDIAIKVAQPR
ncbi:MAG: hypothetical protein ACPG4T_24490, partial [Nannocystaceae bacterium]